MKLNHSNRADDRGSNCPSEFLVLGLIAAMLNIGSGSADAPEKSVAEKNGEAKEKAEPIKGVPPRDIATKPNLIDLSDHFNGSLREGWLPATFSTTAEKNLPMALGVEKFDGVEFDVRGLIQLSGEAIKKADGDFPEQVKGIRIGQKCKRVHVLHAATWAKGVGDSVEIGRLVFHYADGSEREFPIVNGENVRDWVTPSKEDLRRATVVWTGENPAKMELRIYKATWENPSPDVEIKSVDYISKMTAASPFLIAITTE